jgi:RNA polymerase sigma factor (sigma-70 family)
MAAAPLTDVVQHLHTLTADTQSDGQLLGGFARTGDEAAFAALVRRHGPLVLGVCRRVLGSGPDLDDAFQATFLVLARKAGSIRRQTSVGCWLHAVARRLAQQLRARQARRRTHEQTSGQPLDAVAETPAMSADPVRCVGLRELGRILDEELASLPQTCREALVACHLEGLSHTEAAAQLRWPLGTLKARLQRGRELLRRRLEKRGVTLSAAGLAVVLAEQASAMVPAALARAAGKAGAAFAAGKAAAPARAAALAEGVLRTMSAGKVKLALLALVAVGLVGLGAVVFAAAAKEPEVVQEPPPQVGSPPSPVGDVFGDPLPPGAVARLGTVRWRHGAPVQFIALLPDNKTLVTGDDDHVVRVWDLATGKELRRFGPDKADGKAVDAMVNTDGPAMCCAVSKDGRLLAVQQGREPVQVRETATGKLVLSVPVPDDLRYPDGLAFAPDGKLLAMLGTDGAVRLWDLGADKSAGRLGEPVKGIIERRRRPASRPAALVFSPDGKAVAATGVDVVDMVSRTFLHVWDVKTGKLRFALNEPGVQGVHAVAFAPDGATLAYTTPDGRVVVVEAATGKKLQDWRTFQRRDWPLVAFGADGKLYTKLAGGTTVTEWDPATGKGLRTLNPGDSPPPGPLRPAGAVGGLAVSPDGKLLATGGDGHAVRFVDLATGKDQPLPGGHAHELGLVAFAPDGKSLLTRGGDRSLRWWDPASGKELKHLAVPAGASALQATADGRYVCEDRERGGLVLIDTGNSKEVATIPVEKGQVVNAATYFFAPDGKTLLVRRLPFHSIQLYDVPSGKLRCRLTIKDGNDGVGGVPRPVNVLPALFFSPDSRLLGGYCAAFEFGVWDTATGQRLHKFAVDDLGGAAGGAFAPDLRTVALDHYDGRGSVIELASGKVRRTYGTKSKAKNADLLVSGAGRIPAQWFGGNPAATAAFAPDGRLLAFPDFDDGTVRVYDVATGAVLAKFPGHSGTVGVVAFSPDGRTLVSGSTDTTALVWDVSGLCAKAGMPAKALGAEAAAALWADLLADDAGKAGTAVHRLAAAPKEAVPLLEQYLKPAAAVDGAAVEKLIGQLDAADFKTRQLAQAELLKIGDQAVPHLTRAMAGEITLEVRERMQLLLDKLTLPKLTGERLRLVRAVEVLERAGTPEARQLLQTLADGGPGALATTQARAALARIKQ